MSLFGTFRLEVELGNAAMNEPHHVGGLLAKLGDRLLERGFDGDVIDVVRDENGNTVGRWEFDGYEED
jgi:hypothetical protein